MRTLLAASAAKDAGCPVLASEAALGMLQEAS